MNLFKGIISQINSSLAGLNKKTYSYCNCDLRKTQSHSEVILQRDTAFELKGVGFNLITDDVFQNEVVLYGKDLGEIKGDAPFFRLCLLSVDGSLDGQELHDFIKKTEYVKYHFFPEGYMIRSSSLSHKEAVRVSKKAVKDKISFQDIGNLLISQYLEIDGVKGARVIFVTDEKADYKLFQNLSDKNHDIVKALNTLIENLAFDCESCNLKPICDEVEGMREMHFKSAGKKNG